MPTIRRALPYLALAAIVIGFGNFFWFIFESQAIGGDGLNGYATAGHYFIGSHGSYTEVDAGTWEWSRFHASSIFVTHFLAMGGMFFLLIRYIFPSYMGMRTPSAPTSLRAATVRESGAQLAFTRTGGRIGPLNVSGPLITVSVYPRGIIVKPALMPGYVILADEILEVVTKRRWGRGLEIRHAGHDANSPLVIFQSSDGPVSRAIAGLPRAPIDAQVARLPVSQPSVASRVRASLGQSPLFAPIPADAAPRGIVATMEVLGIAVSLVLIASGFLWAIPKLGGFGVIWTVMLIAITAINLAKIVRRRRSGR
jgi:hypothetical protein